MRQRSRREQLDKVAGREGAAEDDEDGTVREGDVVYEVYKQYQRDDAAALLYRFRFLHTVATLTSAGQPWRTTASGPVGAPPRQSRSGHASMHPQGRQEWRRLRYGHRALRSLPRRYTDAFCHIAPVRTAPPF